MNRSSKRRLCRVVTSFALAAVAVGAVISPASALTVEELTAIAEAQFEPLEELAAPDGALGVYRNGTDNVVVIPAEMANDVDAFQELLDSQLEDVVDEIRVSRFTTARLTELQELLGSREATGIGEEYSIVEEYLPESDTYDIQTEAPASITDPLLAAYPGELSVQWGTAESYGRFDDTAPYYGAGAVSNSNKRCTAGVAVLNSSGDSLMTTAGHCYGLNEVIWNGDKSDVIGLVTARGGSYSVDTEVMSSSSEYQARIWTGGTTDSGSSIAVGGKATVTSGTRNVYASGATTLNRLRGTVKSASVNFCFVGGSCIVNGGNGFEYADGVNNAPGDSGGPIFVLNSANKAIILGLVVGGVTTKSGFRNVGVKIDPALRYYGVTLRTS